MNDRARDLADLIVIEELALDGIDDRTIREACVEIFEGRGRRTWPPTIAVFPGWPELWADLVEDEGFPIVDVVDACKRVQVLVDRIDEAR